MEGCVYACVCVYLYGLFFVVQSKQMPSWVLWEREGGGWCVKEKRERRRREGGEKMRV